jgi:8-oxo-dGTP diphosphatase
MTDPSEKTPVVAVGAVVVHERALLMVRRGREPHEGRWTIPGGRVEVGEYLNAAVAREVREETGLEVEVGQLLGVFEVVGEPHFVILDHIAAPKDDAEPVAGEDAEEARWIPLDQVPEMDCTPRLVEMLSAWGVLSEH